MACNMRVFGSIDGMREEGEGAGTPGLGFRESASEGIGKMEHNTASILCFRRA